MHHWVWSRLDKEKREQFEFELDQPLEGESAKQIVATPAMVEAENDALTAIMGMKSNIESR